MLTQLAGDNAASPAGDQKAAAPATDAKTTSGGSGWVWWVLAIALIGGGAGGFYWYRSRKTETEGGEIDMYTRFID